MESNQTKAVVLRSFLDFVSGYLPLDLATFATLGGEGTEARLWQEKGVPGERGWLIERSKRRGRALIAGDLPYHHHSRLATFPRILTSIYGIEASVDAFHFDLCGTIEPNIEEILPAMPLIRRSRGRCFAVTVSDQRRNLSLEQFPRVRRYASRLLGSENVVDYLRCLEEEQSGLLTSAELPKHLKGFDPKNGARRELGFFISMLGLLAAGLDSNAETMLPDKIVRYVFVSRYSGYPCRMRTYFFHLVPVERITILEHYAVKLLLLWNNSSICFVDADGKFLDNTLREDTGSRVLEAEGRKEKAMPDGAQSSKLAQLVGFAGDEVRAEYDALIAKAASAGNVAELREQVATLEAALEEEKAMVARMRAACGDAAAMLRASCGEGTSEAVPAAEAAAPAASAPEATVPAAAPAAEAPAAGPATGGNGKTIPTYSLQGSGRSRFELQLALLQAKAENNGAFEKLCRAVEKDFRKQGCKKPKGVVASIFARTQGGFRGDFLYRLRKEMGTDSPSLSTLAALYTAIVGERVSVATLRADALAGLKRQDAVRENLRKASAVRHKPAV